MNKSTLLRNLLSIVLLPGLFILFSPNAHTSPQPHPDKDWSVGLGFSTVPAGVSGKYYVSDSVSLEGVLGPWRPFRRDPGPGHYQEGIGFDLAFLYEMPAFVKEEPIYISWNYGAAGTIGVTDNSAGIFGGMGVLGLQFSFRPAPIEFALQYRPGIYHIQAGGYGDTDFEFFDLAAHVRYRF